MPELLLKEKGSERTMSIDDDSFTIGRAPDNDLVLEDGAASGRHCIIQLEGGVYKVIDLNSRNGVTVNGERVDGARELSDRDVLGVGYATITFFAEGVSSGPRLMVTEEQYELEKRSHAMSRVERAEQPFGFDRIWPFGLVCDLIARYEQQEAHPVHDVECHAIRLGDVAFATNPFELFVDYGMRIRCQSRALQTFLVQLADGSDNAFYLPTQRALEGGHYSALIKSNWVGPEGGAILVKKTVHAIHTLFEDEEYAQTR